MQPHHQQPYQQTCPTSPPPSGGQNLSFTHSPYGSRIAPAPHQQGNQSGGAPPPMRQQTSPPSGYPTAHANLMGRTSPNHQQLPPPMMPPYSQGVAPLQPDPQQLAFQGVPTSGGHSSPNSFVQQQMMPQQVMSSPYYPNTIPANYNTAAVPTVYRERHGGRYTTAPSSAPHQRQVSPPTSPSLSTDYQQGFPSAPLAQQGPVKQQGNAPLSTSPHTSFSYAPQSVQPSYVPQHYNQFGLQQRSLSPPLGTSPHPELATFPEKEGAGSPPLSNHGSMLRNTLSGSVHSDHRSAVSPTHPDSGLNQGVPPMQPHRNVQSQGPPSHNTSINSQTFSAGGKRPHYQPQQSYLSSGTASNNSSTFLPAGDGCGVASGSVSRSDSPNITAREIRDRHGASAKSQDDKDDKESKASYKTSKGSSSSSSIREELPLCDNDTNCAQINDKKHQRLFSHTCRLFPCYHAHVKRHAKLFRHAPGQLAVNPLPPSSSTGGLSGSGKASKQSQRASLALTSVNFQFISPEAPNAVRLSVTCGSKAYNIFGDWTQVKLHTFKRYLHQVFGAQPVSQHLYLLLPGGDNANRQEVLMDDDLASLTSFGVVDGAELLLKSEDGSDLNDVGNGPRFDLNDL